MEVPRRSVQFVELGGAVTLASLVCEDLAQADEVAGVIRAVGPTIVVTPLLDGPQLSSRWGARYAGVLADDPGSAVLTLTSFGMTQRSRPPGRNPSRVVALWKGHGQLAREIPLDPGAHAILLSATVGAAIRRSFDGRRPGHDGSEFSSVSVRQIRASRHGTQPPHAPVGPSQRLGLTADELTILTSWAEAFAEALAFSPTSIEDLAADARSGAAWREELGVCDPSPLLRQSMNGIAQIARAAVAAGGTPLIALLCSRPTRASQASRHLTGWAAQCFDQRSDSASPMVIDDCAGAARERTVRGSRRQPRWDSKITDQIHGRRTESVSPRSRGPDSMRHDKCALAHLADRDADPVVSGMDEHIPARQLAFVGAAGVLEVTLWFCIAC